MNPHWPPNRKETELRKMAENFSYAAAVKKTKKNIKENCTAEVEDLFKHMFCLDALHRINFADIRKHKLFRAYFPEVA